VSTSLFGTKPVAPFFREAKGWGIERKLDLFLLIGLLAERLSVEKQISPLRYEMTYRAALDHPTHRDAMDGAPSKSAHLVPRWLIDSVL
jgi:hypothetical protein